MRPSLYNQTGEVKLGDLNDCINGIVIEERNGMFEAEITYAIFSPLWDSVLRGNIIVAHANDTLKFQKFRIYKTSKPIKGVFKAFAKHISYDLLRDIIEGLDIENQSCQYCLNQIFRLSQFSQHFKGYSDIINAQNFKIGASKVLNAIVGKEGSVLDTFGTGAELLRDNENVHILNARGHDNGVTIEYGKNLTGIDLTDDDSNMVTRIKAIAKYNDTNGDEVIVNSEPKYIDSPKVLDYETPFIEEIDFSDKFGENETPTPSKLRTLAEKYFRDTKCDFPKTNAKISFIPLSKCVGYEGIEDAISLCDIVTIKDYRYNYETKAKVIKTTYNFLTERYESMEVGEPRSKLGDVIGGNGQDGKPGRPGPPGPPGADGNIENFPDTLPSTPILSSKLHGFASIELNWTFENLVYYSYELYASKTKDFTPNVFDIIHQGQSSSFLFAAKPNETWYFRVCCVNSHGKRTAFSNQIAVTTVKIDDLSNYVDNAAIGEALIGTLSLDRGWFGVLKGNYIDAKQLSVTDGNGKRTLDIDSFGNVNLDVASLKIKGNGVATQTYVSSENEKLQTQITANAEGIKEKVNASYVSQEITKSATETVFKFTNSGGRNLLWNSNFDNGLAHWEKSGSPPICQVGAYRANPYGKKVLALNTNARNQNVFQTLTGLVVGETYNISCYVYVARGQIVLMENNFWSGVYSKGTGWQWLEFNITPTSASVTIYIGSNEYTPVDNSIHVGAVQVTLGATRVQWQPNSGETYEGNTKMDKDGMEILNGGLKLKNKKNQEVFFADPAGNVTMGVYDSKLTISATGDRKTEMWCDYYDKFILQVPYTRVDGGIWIKRDTGATILSDLVTADNTHYKVYVADFTSPSAKISNLYVTGTKNCLQATKTYGERLINAYETAEYFFGDIGSGVIKDGQCVVAIDDILQECVNTNIQYHVFTQIYKGSITKIERYQTYFIVYGSDNTEFSWELKAKRIGYENNRFDIVDDNNPERIDDFHSILDEGQYEDKYKIIEVENVLDSNPETSDISSILLEDVFLLENVLLGGM